MNPFVKTLLVKSAVAVCFGAILIAVIPSHPTAVQGAGSAPVTVIGPLPLPVALQGTGTISGNVNASQSGTWGVNINGTPTVIPSNTAETPLYVVNGGPAKQRHQKRISALSYSGLINKTWEREDLDIPEGKEFVVEMMSMEATFSHEPENVIYFAGAWFAPEGPVFFDLHFMGADGTGPNLEHWVGNVETAATITDSLNVNLQLKEEPSYQFYVTLGLFGYLEDMP